MINSGFDSKEICLFPKYVKIRWGSCIQSVEYVHKYWNVINIYILKFYEFNDSCIKCPQGTKWNGKYCWTASALNWCLGRSFTQYNNGGCPCIQGYINIDGVCVPSA